jgi:hypothetical protein
MEVPPFPLSSRAKPRDLRFYGPLLEMFGGAFASPLLPARLPGIEFPGAHEVPGGILRRPLAFGV